MAKLKRYASHLHTMGAATLVMALMLVFVSTIIIIFAANFGLMQDKVITNITRNNQAFEAAQAGLEYGVNYLNKRSATILFNPVSGYIQPYSDSNTSNVTLSNNSKYTITYSNPTAYNYKTIKISSTGISDDDTSTRTVSQLVQFGSTLLNIPTKPLFSKGSVSLAASSQIQNDYNNYTIDSASSVSLTDSSQTILNSGTSSTPALLKSDVTENNSILNDMSSADFFSSYFGLSDSLVKSSVGFYYENSTDTNYRTMLSGKTATSIWIDQTAGLATINGFSFIGSSSDPVLLIVNGNNVFTGFVIIYGFLFVNGTITTASGANINIIGGVSSTGDISGPGTFQVYYSPTVLNNLQTQRGMQYYAKIPGSWKDF